METNAHLLATQQIAFLTHEPPCTLPWAVVTALEWECNGVHPMRQLAYQRLMQQQVCAASH